MLNKKEELKKAVREGYGKIAKSKNTCCGPDHACCCGGDAIQEISKRIGYSEEEIKMAPEGANLGLGCGNPVAIASLKEGEVVLDLGSGAGFDCFLAARKVGEKGRVIGVDMTSEMVEEARKNALKGGYNNVEFRLGEIENLPVADNFVDTIISNCVINLSPDKDRVFKEAFRVLRPGGRIIISDMVLLAELPEIIKNSIEAYLGCLAGAVKKDEYMKIIEDAGFQKVKILEETSYSINMWGDDPTFQAMISKMNIPSKDLVDAFESIISIKVYGVKPVK
ncbi:MAG: arsenite methyltransferase [Candidatus Caldatribacteriota bacterium]